MGNEINIKGIFCAKNKTAAQWTSENPILRDGEIGREKDTRKSKVGDGVTKWNDLPYEIVETAKLNSPAEISNYSVSDILDAASDLAIGEMRVWNSFNDGTILPGEPVRCPLGGTIQRVYQQEGGNKEAVVITAFGVDATTGKQYAFIRTVGNGVDSGWSSLGGDSGGLSGKEDIEGLEYLLPGNTEEIVPVIYNDSPDTIWGGNSMGWGFVAYGNPVAGLALALLQNSSYDANWGAFIGKVQSDGTGVEWEKVATTDDNQLIPGFKLVCTTVSDIPVINGSVGVASFIATVPRGAFGYIVAEIRSAAGPSSSLLLTFPLIFFTFEQNSIVLDSNPIAGLSTATTPRLVCTIAQNAANYGVMNIKVASNNLSPNVINGVIRIKGIYAKL